MEWTLRQIGLPKPSSRSILLELPSEIRDLIFLHALSSSRPLVAFHLDEYQKDSYYHEATQPALTRVSRQIREETLPIFYGNNNFVLHSRAPKITHSQEWLRSIEPRIPLLKNISFWMSYVTLMHHDRNEVNESNGAICLSLHRPRRGKSWQVQDEWQWIPVTRKPASLKGDARFLISELSKMLIEEPNCLDNADDIVGTMTSLKMLYVKEKMS